MSTRKAQPSVEITKVTRNRVCFVLRNCDVSFANSLRRIMIAEVPTLAIELVTVHENTSVLHDEFISHRLGLLPIDSSHIRNFKYKEDCSCAEKCRQCCVEFQLDVVCRESQGLTVTHFDISGTNPDPKSPMPVPRQEDAADIFSSGIAITKLRKNQRIKCDLVATKGIGKLHAKWIPVATAVYQYEPEVYLHERLLETVPSAIQQEIAQSCPRQVFSCEGDTFAPQTLNVVNRNACIFCDECVAVAKERGYPDLVTISQKQDVFRFVVESTGVMPAEQIVSMAFEVLEAKLRNVMAETVKLEGFNQDATEAKYGRDQYMHKEPKGATGGIGWAENLVLDLS